MIDFVSTSDKVSPLVLSRPIVDELKVLEMEGVEACDAHFNEIGLVVAPLLCIICNNPRAAELLNHLGSTAKKYCRFCMVSVMLETFMDFENNFFCRLIGLKALIKLARRGANMNH